MAVPKRMTNMDTVFFAFAFALTDELRDLVMTAVKIMVSMGSRSLTICTRLADPKANPRFVQRHPAK